MKRKCAKIFYWVITISTIVIGLKWILYDSWMDLNICLFDCLFFPILLAIKLLTSFFIYIWLLALNAYLFTNTFDKEISPE